MCSKNRIGNRNVLSKLPIIVFQINSISLIESEEFRENLECKHKNYCKRNFNVVFTLCDSNDHTHISLFLSVNWPLCVRLYSENDIIKIWNWEIFD